MTVVYMLLTTSSMSTSSLVTILSFSLPPDSSATTPGSRPSTFPTKADMLPDSMLISSTPSI